MTLATFFRLFNTWILLYSYWLIDVLVESHAKEDKSDFFFYLGCLFYGTLFGTILGFAIIPYFFDITFYPTPEVVCAATEAEKLNLILDLNSESLTDTSLEEKQQKELEELRENSLVWTITVLFVYYCVFSS